MANAMPSLVGWLSLLVSTLVVACDSEDDRISELDSLRIIAVKSDQPFAAPNSRVSLEMLVNDASSKAVSKDGTRRQPKLLWFGSCVNPDGDLYYKCFPQLHESMSSISDEELNGGKDTENTANARLGFGSSYQLNVPADTIESRPKANGISSPYGVVMMFYAACGGHLRVRRNADVESDYPISCVDKDTGKELNQSEFEFGFYPIYVYERLKNTIPIVKSIDFAAEASGKDCASDDDCEKSESCGSKAVCIPRISACKKGEKCKNYKLNLSVDQKSVEPAVSAYIPEAEAPRETLWVSYYSDFGEFEKDARIIHDGASGYTKDYAGIWTPKVTEESPSTPREAHVYAVVRDNRGGVTWVTKDVRVE
jgi:hypothetical protein